MFIETCIKEVVSLMVGVMGGLGGNLSNAIDKELFFGDDMYRPQAVV
jgi:hypothetical protein